MELLLQQATNRQRIEGYGAGNFTINGIRHEGSLLVLPESVLSWDGELSADSILNVLPPDAQVEVLIIGTGASLRLLSPDFRSAMKQRAIAADAMDTGAACRTFNVLASEERRVAVALLAL